MRDHNDDVVTTGTNAADGAITLDAVHYDTKKLEADVLSGAASLGENDEGKLVYTYAYQVSEDVDPATGAPLDPNGNVVDGAAVVAGSFSVTVTVTDNGDGTLACPFPLPAGRAGVVNPTAPLRRVPPR